MACPFLWLSSLIRSTNSSCSRFTQLRFTPQISEADLLRCRLRVRGRRWYCRCRCWRGLPALPLVARQPRGRDGRLFGVDSTSWGCRRGRCARHRRPWRASTMRSRCNSPEPGEALGGYGAIEHSQDARGACPASAAAAAAHTQRTRPAMSQPAALSQRRRRRRAPACWVGVSLFCNIGRSFLPWQASTLRRRHFNSP